MWERVRSRSGASHSQIRPVMLASQWFSCSPPQHPGNSSPAPRAVSECPSDSCGTPAPLAVGTSSSSPAPSDSSAQNKWHKSVAEAACIQILLISNFGSNALLCLQHMLDKHLKKALLSFQHSSCSFFVLFLIKDKLCIEEEFKAAVWHREERLQPESHQFKMFT